MKKRELISFMVFLIKEGVMDHLTTQISRVIVNHLKKNLDQEQIPSFKGQVNDLLLQAQFQRYNGPLRQAGGDYNDAIRRLQVFIAVPFEFNTRQLSEFIPTLKNTIRHELEHYRQDQRSGYLEPAKGVHHTLPGLPMHDKPLGNNPFATIETAKTYLLRPREVEAWVMGMYKQAKTQKIPLQTVMQRQSDELAKGMPNAKISQKQARQFANDLLVVWTDYAAQRLQFKKTGDVVK